MSETCQFLHNLANSLKIFDYPFNPKDIPLNGIYIMFEYGEFAHGGKRIVRVGTHTGPNNLRNRLEEHFTKENKDRSIFRKNIGRALLNKDEDPFLGFWELDLTSKEERIKNEEKFDPEKQASVERQVTDYIQKRISFVVLEIPDKKKRMELEAQMISIIYQCRDCGPSYGWLGLDSPVPKIPGGGLWGSSFAMAPLKPPPKRRPPRQAGVREEDARLANDPPPPIINANSLSGEGLEV